MSLGESYDNKGLKHTVLKVEIKNNLGKSSNFSSDCEFIFVLDKSGSMGNYVNEILTRVFPKVYDKLHFKEDKKIHLLTFDHNVNSYIYNKKDFKNSSIYGDGGTSMSEIPIELEKILNNFNSNKAICLLTLSDGMISDQDRTQENSVNLVKKLNGRFTNFNSQAIRFMSSDYAEPDTRALCSLLQLNSNLQNNNSDILLTFNPIDNNNANNYNMSDNKCEELATKICKLFESSKGSGWILKAKINIYFKIDPYGENLSFLELPKGKTTVFINKLCVNHISNDISLSSKDNSKKGSLVSKGEVTQNNLYQVYQEIIEKLMKKVIINKGIENTNSKNNNKNIINFIKDLEDKTPGTKKDNKNLTKVFENINNDQSANNLNGNQLNDYINKKLNECQKSIDTIVNKEIKKKKVNKNTKRPNNEDEEDKPSKDELKEAELEENEPEQEEKNLLKNKRKRTKEDDKPKEKKEKKAKKEKKEKKDKTLKKKKEEVKKIEDEQLGVIMGMPVKNIPQMVNRFMKCKKMGKKKEKK